MNKVVVYASDGNDINMLRASIFSVRKFLGDEVKIYVLSEELTDNDFNDVTVIDPHELLDSVGFHGAGWNRKWSYAALFRMVIPLSEEFQQYEKVLYLDTDTLVVSDKINELFEIDPKGREIIGSRDSFGTSERIKKCIYKDLNNEASRGILSSNIWANKKIEDSIYINSGVTVWCIKNIITNGLIFYKIRLRWFWEAETRGKFDYVDQDFINSMMDVYRIPHKRFNTFMNHRIEDPDGTVIKHFISGSKPNFMPTAYKLGYKEEPCKNQNIIVYSSDGNDSEHLKLSIKSVKKFLGSNVKIYILTELKEYPGIKDVTLINPLNVLESIGLNKRDWPNRNKRWTFNTMFRLAIPFLDEFKDVDKVLYLDTDTLVMSRKALRLFNIRSNGYEVYGVPDIDDMQNSFERLYQEVGYNALSLLKSKVWNSSSRKALSYINAGAILMCLNEIRNNDLAWYSKRLKMFWDVFIAGRFKFNDQDFINAYLKVNPSISKKYNHLCSINDNGFSKDCIIQHFVGRQKDYMNKAAKYLSLET